MTTVAGQSGRLERAMTDAEERFSWLVASGESASESYRQAFPERTQNPVTIWSTAQDVRSRVAHRIAHHREQIQRMRDAAGHGSVAGKLELEQFATRALRAPLALTPRDSDLIQKLTTTIREDERGTTTKETVELVGKATMMQELSKLAGHYAPAQLEVQATAMTGLFARIASNDYELDERGRVIENETEDYAALLD